MNVDEQAVTGSIYTRCYGINISNPHDAIPEIKFQQESVLKTDVGIVTLKGIESITTAFQPDEEFPLFNGSTMTHETLYSILYAAWLHYKSAVNTEAHPNGNN
jgi:hypothetical protein